MVPPNPAKEIDPNKLRYFSHNIYSTSWYCQCDTPKSGRSTSNGWLTDQSYLLIPTEDFSQRTELKILTKGILWYIQYNRTGLTVTLRWRIQKKFIFMITTQYSMHQKMFATTIHRNSLHCLFRGKLQVKINSLKHSRGLVQLTLTWGGPRAWRGASSVIVAWGPTWGASWRPAVVGPKPARSSTKTVPRSSLMVSRTIVIIVIIVSIATAVYEKKKLGWHIIPVIMVTIEKIVTVCTVMIKKVVYIIVTHNVNMIANNNTFLDGDFYHHRSHLVVNQSQPLSTLFLFSLLLSLSLSYR